MSERAVSEVVSYVLVFALIVSAVGIISVSGFASLQDTRNAEQVANAERAYDVMANNIADIYRRGAPGRATEINLGDARISTADNITMSVEVSDDDGSSWESAGSWPIRPIVYTGDEERELVYEAGAVFRTSRDGGIRIRDPPFVVQEDQVLISVVGINRPNAQSLSGSTVLVRARQGQPDQEPSPTTMEYANSSDSITDVRVTIEETPRFELWRTYFENNGFDCPGSGVPVECTFDPDSASTIDRVYVVHHDITVNIDQ